MALPGETSSKDGYQGNKTNDLEDKDFDPSVEALIDDIDDERTLEEEEALGATTGAAVQEELDDLKRESEMPIEELLAYYERMRNQAGGEVEEEEEEDEDDEEVDDEEVEDDEHERVKKSCHAGPKPDRDDSGCPVTTQQASSTNKQPIQGSNPAKSTAEAENRSDQQTNSGAPNSSTSHQTTKISQELSNERVSPQDSGVQTIDSAVDTSLESKRHLMSEFSVDDRSSGMFRSLLDYDLDESDDMDEDYSYTDDEIGDEERDWRRSIHIGTDYQAEVPDGLSKYEGDLPPYENEDKLVWKCNTSLSEEDIIDFLKQASLISKRTDISISPASVPKISSDSTRLYRERMQELTSSASLQISEHNGEGFNHETPHENITDVYMSQSRKRPRIDYELEQENALDGLERNHLTGSREDNSNSTSQDTRPELSTEYYFQDEEQLLYLLLQCNYNFEEALRRRKLDPSKYYLNEPMSLWSQEECLGFEHGLRVYGKDFRAIRENQVQTRTHAEVVAFYYLWKKSERHDVYTNQYKLDRKRCLSHPGTTDYMDKFIEDNESNLNASSSSTPTPTDSTTEFNQSTFNTTNEYSSLCNSSDPLPPRIQYINLPQDTNFQKHHLQLHQNQNEDESGQKNSVYVDSNTPI